jgi:hypothetical protein
LLRATDISSQTRVTLNDCLYVALAEREGVERITSDQRLINALQKGFAFEVDLATLPVDKNANDRRWTVGLRATSSACPLPSS